MKKTSRERVVLHVTNQSQSTRFDFRSNLIRRFWENRRHLQTYCNTDFLPRLSNWNMRHNFIIRSSVWMVALLVAELKLNGRQRL